MADPDHTLTQSILRDIRRDQKQLQDLLLTFIETTRRRFDGIERRFEGIERRFEGIERNIKDGNADLELMLKGELLGRLTHFETRMDERFAAAEDRNKAPTAS
jgi:hypothetical protein